MKLSVVMPVYNEAGHIEKIVDTVLAVPVEKELVIVDDCSKDGTRDKLVAIGRRPGVRVLLHEVNQGKGAALRTGFRAATGDLVIVQDADLEYDPREYPRLIQPVIDGQAEVVFGTRFPGGGPRAPGAFVHTAGNRSLTFVSNLVTGYHLTDMETCYKVFKRQLIQSIPIEENRFGFEPEITAKLARRGVRILEVPVSYAGRTYEEGKKIGWKDAVRAIWCIFKYGY
ncbi:MAG TPA: glycosyltransferase family 2 protein [Planctomycetota bacterium]|nr:glycosyltransferase family 2 protein [Planctomycetota bacterium]